MQINSLLKSVIVWWLACQQAKSLAIVRNKDYRGSTPGEVIASKEEVNPEPSCEELKAMWRFSKRQSRAAEITNEIPTYRDPFSYNVWDPYPATSRSVGGMRIGYRPRPVYGRVVHKVPVLRIQDIAEKNRAFEEITRKYGNMQKPVSTEPRRRMTAFRLSGGGTPMGIPPQTGSFQHLKELIRTERARELQEQRLAEEAAARNEALNELANRGNNHYSHKNFRDPFEHHHYDGPRKIAEDEAAHVPKAILAFPDLLAPAASFENPEEAQFVEDFSYFRDRPRNQGSIMQRGNSFYYDMDGYAL